MTKLGGCGYFWDDEGGMTKFGFRCYSRNHKAVMLRRSRSIHGWAQGRWVLWVMRWLAGDGFRDCARNDEVGGAAVTSGMTKVE